MESTATLQKTKHPDQQKPGKRSNGHRPVRQKPEDTIWRLSVDRYHQMIEAGVLTDDDPVELLEGWLIQKMPKGPRHSSATYGLRRIFEKLLVGEWYVDSQEAITLADSEPEPDLFIARGSQKQFRHRHPYAEDLILLVEVADATLNRDRNLKKRVYAQAGIPQYWIVNLVDNQIEVYSEPTANPDTGKAKTPTYLQRKDYGMTDSVSLLVAGEVIGTILVDDIITNEA